MTNYFPPLFIYIRIFLLLSEPLSSDLSLFFQTSESQSRPQKISESRTSKEKSEPEEISQ